MQATVPQVDLLRQSCVRFAMLSPDEDLRGVVRENLFFHNAILDNGAVPLNVLEGRIDAWIAAERRNEPMPAKLTVGEKR